MKRYPVVSSAYSTVFNFSFHHCHSSISKLLLYLTCTKFSMPDLCRCNLSATPLPLLSLDKYCLSFKITQILVTSSLKASLTLVHNFVIGLVKFCCNYVLDICFSTRLLLKGKNFISLYLWLEKFLILKPSTVLNGNIDEMQPRILK